MHHLMGWRRWLAFGVLSLFLQTACSHTMVIHPASEADRIRLKRAATGQNVRITTKQTTVKGRVITIKGTHLQWQPEHSTTITRTPLSEIRRMTWKRRGRGFLEGFGIGVATFGFIGFIGTVSGTFQTEVQGPGESFPWYYSVIAISVPGLIGGLIGMAIGSKTVVNVQPKNREKTHANAHKIGFNHVPKN